MPDPIDYDKMTESELDALLKAEGLAEPEETPPPSPVASEEPQEEPQPEPEVIEPQPEPVEDPEPGIDAESFEAEGVRIKTEKLEADLNMQKAHSSRLAGEIGYLKQQLKAIPHSSEPYEPQSQAEMDRLSQLEQRFAESETRRNQIEVAQAVESAIGALDVPEITQSLMAEIGIVAPRYAEQLQSAKEISDPQLARQIADAIGRSVIADAKELAWSNRRKSLEEKKAVQAKDLVTRKKAATVSGSGATSAPKPAPKTYDDWTLDELDAELRASTKR